MKQIPENNEDVKIILYQQLGLLAEESKKCLSESLPSITNSMVEVARTIKVL